eukprot:1799232-Rhodomonas_salina.1
MVLLVAADTTLGPDSIVAATRRNQSESTTNTVQFGARRAFACQVRLDFAGPRTHFEAGR